MPVYKYITIEEDDREGEIFEVEQSINSKPLEKHPESGKPVRRIYESPNLNLQYTHDKELKRSDPKYIKSKGFQILQKDKISGKYYKL